MASLLKEFAKLQSRWKATAKTSHKQIAKCFDSNKKEILSPGTHWFLEDLIRNQQIESLKYVLQLCNAKKYINSNCDTVLGIICECGTLEMFRLIVSIGIDNYNSINVAKLIVNLIQYNITITVDEIYIFIEYLLTNINDDISKYNILSRLAELHNKSWDPIKITKIIESKTVFSGSNNPSISFCRAVQHKNFKFATFLVDEYNVDIDPFLYGHNGWQYSDKDIIEWLLKHNVDINGYISKNKLNYPSDKITPLFICCTHKKYDQIELLLNYGANIQKMCIYNKKEMTVLQFCEKNFEQKYVEYFKNYKTKNIENNLNTFLGINLSNIPITPYDEQELLLNNKNNMLELNKINNEYFSKQNEISKLEKELNIKYTKLQSLIIKKYELESKKENSQKWIEGQKIWIKFLNEWKNWNVSCFMQYLKRVKYVKKSYNEYYSNDNECKQKIENYVKNNLIDAYETKEGDHDINKNSYFDGKYLLKFTKKSINNIGITELNDIEGVYCSLQKLIKNNNGINKYNDNNINDGNTYNDQNIIQKFLTKINLNEYLDTFKHEGYETLDDLKYINENDLRQIGIKKQAHINRILRETKQL